MSRGAYRAMAKSAAVAPGFRFAHPSPRQTPLNPPLQRAHEDRACGATVELYRIAAGGRIFRRHLHDQIDLVVADLETGERVRNAALLARFEHEIHEGAKIRPQPDIGGEPLDLVLDGLAVERQHV